MLSGLLRVIGHPNPSRAPLVVTFAVASCACFIGLALTALPAAAQGFEEARLLPFSESGDFDLLNDPRAVTVDQSGTVFVLNENRNYIEELSAGGSPRRGTALNAFGLAVTLTSNAQGALFVGGDLSGEGIIQEISPGGSPETLPATGLRQVEGIAVDEAGDVFAVGTGTRGVVERVHNGERKVLPIIGIAPQAVALNRAGNLVVGDHSTSGSNPAQVEEVPLEGEPTILIPSYALDNANEIAAIAFDPTGDMFISAWGARSVFEMPAGAEYPIELTLTAPDNLAEEEAIGLAVDDTGDLYVSYLGNGDPGTETGYVLEAPVSSGLVATPNLTNITPKAGLQAGGTSVTITGTNLNEATAVDFGSTSATSFTLKSPTEVTATAPPGSGTVDVIVTTPGGTSATSSADHFSYVPAGPAPTVKKVSPAKGPAAGGTSVTITGTGFTGITAVDFGSTEATSYTVNSATSITAISPAETTGTVDVTVTTPNGTSAISTKDHFAFEAPTITSVGPNSGSKAGGTAVTVTGTGFGLGSIATTFKFSKGIAIEVECTSTTTCTMLSPAAAKVETADVTATVDKKTGEKDPPADEFVYH
jgi:IPT/TIG domain